MKKPFFGWYIVAAGIFFTAFNSLLFVYGFTAFMDPIAATFGWGTAQISLASSIRGLQTGTMDPLVGPLVDRFSARKLMVAGLIIFTLGVVLISQATGLVMFYAGFVVVGIGGAISITMIPTTVSARWFKKNIGKASGLLAVGVAAGGMFTPLLVNAIDAFTWQNTMLYLAIGLLIIGLPMALVFRNSPSEYGMLPDGEEASEEMVKAEADSGMTVKEAIRTRPFWFISIATMLQMIAINAVTVHMMTHLINQGMEKEQAALAVSVFSIITIVARLVYGVVADIFSKKNVMAFSMLFTAIGLVLFQTVAGSSFVFLVIFALVYGIGIAGAMPLRAPIIREYFGVKRFGSIFGLMAVFLTLGVSGGSPLAGWVYDTRGEYMPIWFVFAGLSVIAMIMIYSLKKPGGNKTNA